jgi:glucose/mannose-6-phosphate isomerase
MNLDDRAHFEHLDQQNMLAEIDQLPGYLETAWKKGLLLHLPDWKGIERVVLAGMGGSAIAADLLAAYLHPTCKLPIHVHRDYGAPAWATGPETLLIASSHSGNTEETLDSFETGIKNKCHVLAIGTGGSLAQRASQVKAPIWIFEHNGQPRSAIGHSFGMLLAVLTRLGLIHDPSNELVATLAEMRKQKKLFAPHIPASTNPAKRLAGQLVGRWINMIGSEVLAPVARRWKGQFNELAKAGAGFDCLPEADHNSLAGLTNPAGTLDHTVTIFLNAGSYHARNQIRMKLTQKAYMLAGSNTNDYKAPGDGPLAQQWSAVHFGDYTAYYLAMAYGEDPTPVLPLQEFKQQLG